MVSIVFWLISTILSASFLPNLISFKTRLDKYCVLCHSRALSFRLCESHCLIGYRVLLGRSLKTYSLFNLLLRNVFYRDLDDHISMSPTYYKPP